MRFQRAPPGAGCFPTLYQTTITQRCDRAPLVYYKLQQCLSVSQSVSQSVRHPQFEATVTHYNSSDGALEGCAIGGCAKPIFRNIYGDGEPGVHKGCTKIVKIHTFRMWRSL